MTTNPAAPATPIEEPNIDPWLEYTVQCFRCGGGGCLECMMTGRRPRYFDELAAARDRLAELGDNPTFLHLERERAEKAEAELAELKRLAANVLHCREKEATAILAAENARANYTDCQPELDVMENAMCLASDADEALRAYLERKE